MIPRLRAAFLSATHASSAANVDAAAHRVDLNIAGLPVQIVYADEALRDAFAPSLSGLVVKPPPSAGGTTRGLSIHAWTGRAGEMPCPDIIADLERFPDKISVVNAGDLHLQYNPDGKILSCIDTGLGEAYYYAADASKLPDYEVCTPMRMLFNWSCAMSGALMVHAAAVGKDGVGVLIVGKSGAGKSTTALQCLLNGLDYLGDDYV
ncbi:MAG: hypothetical protein KUL75_05780, partial [Sterolibacterium sp.]|nr:hypothetical protein [Sterolibacterium sp.]